MQTENIHFINFSSSRGLIFKPHGIFPQVDATNFFTSLWMISLFFYCWIFDCKTDFALNFKVFSESTLLHCNFRAWKRLLEVCSMRGFRHLEDEIKGFGCRLKGRTRITSGRKVAPVASCAQGNLLFIYLSKASNISIDKVTDMCVSIISW